MKQRLHGILFVLLGLLIAGVAAAQVSGGIDGNVSGADGKSIPGATVTVTSVEGSRSTTTDGSGRFRFETLTPGDYTLKADMHGFTSVEQKGIGVRLGSRTRLEVTLTAGTAATMEVTAAPPVVNLASTTTGASISSDLMKSVPIGRNFASTLQLAPGVVEGGVGQGNPSIGGASGLENTYVVDGVNINNSGYGSLGAYSIIFGSLGTGVNFDYIQEVQVKTGGYEPEYGEALGGYVNLITKSGGNEFKGSVYTYLDPASIEGDRKRSDRTNATSDTLEAGAFDVGGEAGGPLVEDKAFLYGAFNPQFNTAKRTTSLAVSADQGFAHTASVDSSTYNYAANLKLFPGSGHTLAVSAFGDPSKGDLGPNRASAFASADFESRFSELTYGGHNVTGRWNAEVSNNWFLEGSVSYHQDKFEEDFAPENNTPNGTDLRGPTTVRTGGLGYFADSKSKNLQYRLKSSNYVNLGGEHNFRVGVEVQDISYDDFANYTGPSGVMLPGGIVSTSGYTWTITPVRFTMSRVRSGNLANATTATYVSGYASDSWSISKSLSLMFGVRYEQNKIVGGNAEMELKDNWGPRAHLTYDPSGDGKTKLSAAYGRFYGKIPNDIAVRVFGGEVSHLARWRLDQVDVSDPLNPVITGDPFAFFTFGDEPSEIDPGTKTTMMDEFVFSAEREVAPSFNLGATLSLRNLGRALEDVGDLPYSVGVATGDFGHYIITNPTVAAGHPEAVRDYTALTIKADKRLSNHWQMLASYTWSKLEGNYEGFYRRDNGQSDPGLTSLYDWPYLADPQIWKNVIESGVLPNDRTNVFNLHSSYSFSNGFTAGMGMRIQSGIPITKLGWNEAYGNGGEIPLEARGASGRGDTTTEFDMHLDYPISLGSAKVSLVADIFNLFNSQNGVDYNTDFELGGTINPDPSLALAPCPDCVDPDFGKILVFQAPRSFRFSARFSF